MKRTLGFAGLALAAGLALVPSVASARDRDDWRHERHEMMERQRHEREARERFLREQRRNRYNNGYYNNGYYNNGSYNNRYYNNGNYRPGYSNGVTRYTYDRWGRVTGYYDRFGRFYRY